MSYILTASGSMISPEILSPRPRGEAWSTMQWPNENPTMSDMALWRNAMHAICPSRCLSRGVGRFVRQTHRIWKWYWNSDESTLHRTNEDGISEDVFIAGRKPNCVHFLHSKQQGETHFVCSVQPTLDGQNWRLISTTSTVCRCPNPNNIPRGPQIVGQYVAVGKHDRVRRNGMDPSLHQGQFSRGRDGQHIYTQIISQFVLSSLRP
jgi:hypothetical protein